MFDPLESDEEEFDALSRVTGMPVAGHADFQGPTRVDSDDPMASVGRFTPWTAIDSAQPTPSSNTCECSLVVRNAM